MRSRYFCRVVVMALITWGLASPVVPAQTLRSSDGPVLLQDLSFTSSNDQTNVAVRASRPFRLHLLLSESQAFHLGHHGCDNRAWKRTSLISRRTKWSLRACRRLVTDRDPWCASSSIWPVPSNTH